MTVQFEASTRDQITGEWRPYGGHRTVFVLKSDEDHLGFDYTQNYTYIELFQYAARKFVETYSASFEAVQDEEASLHAEAHPNEDEYPRDKIKNVAFIDEDQDIIVSHDLSPDVVIHLDNISHTPLPRTAEALAEREHQ